MGKSPRCYDFRRKLRNDSISLHYAKSGRAKLRAMLRRPKRNPALELTISGRSTFDVESPNFFNANGAPPLTMTNRSSSSSARGVKCKSVLKRTKTPDFKPKSRTRVTFQTSVEFVN